MNVKMNRIHSSVDEHVDSLRADTSGELDTLRGKVHSITDTIHVVRTERDRSVNIVL